MGYDNIKNSLVDAATLIAFVLGLAFILGFGMLWEAAQIKDAPLNEQISLSAVLLKVSGGGEYCFERADKTYCVRRTK